MTPGPEGEFWPKMEPCKKHPARVGTMQYGSDKPKLWACELCAKEDGKDLGVLIVDGNIRGPVLPSIIQQYLGEAINSIRYDLLQTITGWTGRKEADIPLTITGETKVPKVNVLGVPKMRVEIKVVIGEPTDVGAKP